MITEAFHIDRVNHVHHDEHSKDFAKHYAAAHKGDHRSGGPIGKDEHHSETFHNAYTYKSIRHGFGGSGEGTYTHNTTGDVYHVRKSSNGETFYGTDHHIKKLPKSESTNPMNAPQQIRSVAETYFEMQQPTAVAAPAPSVRPTWVPSNITEAQLPEFTKLVIEAQQNGTKVVEFDGKKYGISEASEAELQKKSIEDAESKEDKKPAQQNEDFPPAKKDDEPKSSDDTKDDPKDSEKKDDDGDQDADDEKDDSDDEEEVPKADHPDAKHKAALAADKFSHESYQQRGESIMSVAATYAAMMTETAAPAELTEDNKVTKKEPGFEGENDDPSTKKTLEDAKKDIKIEDDPAKVKPDVKTKKSEHNEPEDSSKKLPDAEVVERPDEKKDATATSEAPENKTKGTPDHSAKPAVVENPTGAETLSKAAVPQTHPSGARGATQYPDLQGKTFPSQASSVIKANEEAAPGKDAITEAAWNDHIEHLSKAANSMSAHANKTGHKAHHAMAAHLHDLAFQSTEASETAHENKLAHAHHSAWQHHNKLAAGTNESVENIDEAKDREDGYEMLAKHASEMSAKANESGKAEDHHLAAHLHHAAIHVASYRYAGGTQQPHWKAIAAHRKAAGGNIPGLAEQTGAAQPDDMTEEVAIEEAKKSSPDLLTVAAHATMLGKSIKAHNVAHEAHKAAAKTATGDNAAHHKAMAKHHADTVRKLRIQNWRF